MRPCGKRRMQPRRLQVYCSCFVSQPAVLSDVDLLVLAAVLGRAAHAAVLRRKAAHDQATVGILIVLQIAFDVPQHAIASRSAALSARCKLGKLSLPTLTARPH